MRITDMTTRKYIMEQGWRMDDEGILHLTPSQMKTVKYTSLSARRQYKDKQLIILPAEDGKRIYIDGYHFVVDAK